MNTLRKNRVVLSDYDYRRDIDNRILMSQLSIFEIEALREILDGSISFTTQTLADHLNVEEGDLTDLLDKLTKSKFLVKKGSQITVDKEMRKYFEFQIQKFDKNFEPNMDYIEACLNRISKHILPQWYSIPRTSNCIFSSIIENYFETPKIYERYLQELQFNDPIIKKIIRDVFQASDLKLCSKALREKYSLTRHQFEECMLQLEYHFVCYHHYLPVDEMWEEVISPFTEWREYLLFHQKTKPSGIKDDSNIIQQGNGLMGEAAHYSEKDLREIEKSLRYVAKSGWVYFEDFLKSLSVPIGHNEPVALKQKGKKWKYVLPIYTESEKNLIESIIFGRFFQHGIVLTGLHDGKPCFCVTPFGRSTMGD